jgi:hypothetical protein
MGTEHHVHFAGTTLKEFLYDVCQSLAARDVVRVFQLKIAGQIVASKIGFVVSDSIYLYYSGFDPVWDRYSVMTTTLAEAFKYGITNRLKTANLSITPHRGNCAGVHASWSSTRRCCTASF